MPEYFETYTFMESFTCHQTCIFLVWQLGVKNPNGTNKLMLNELVEIGIKDIRAFRYTIPLCNSYTKHDHYKRAREKYIIYNKRQ